MAPSAVIETKKAFDRLSNATPSGLPAGSGCRVNSRSTALPPLTSSPRLRSADATVAPPANTATAKNPTSIGQRWSMRQPPKVGCPYETTPRSKRHARASVHPPRAASQFELRARTLLGSTRAPRRLGLSATASPPAGIHDARLE